MPWTSPSPLVLYHGTVDLHVASIVRGVDVTIGGLSKDFSRGFYTTTYFAQARIYEGICCTDCIQQEPDGRLLEFLRSRGT